jgi:hypothetical protein
MTMFVGYWVSVSRRPHFVVSATLHPPVRKIVWCLGLTVEFGGIGEMTKCSVVLVPGSRITNGFCTILQLYVIHSALNEISNLATYIADWVAWLA